jgi:hypothetical protein
MIVLLEIVGGEPQTPVGYSSRLRLTADAHFEQIATEGELVEYTGVDLENEVAGTLRFAGDDVHSVHLFEIRVTA